VADLATRIDASAVRAQHGEAEIRALVSAATKWGFLAVHVLPCWVEFVKSLIAGSPRILIGAPVGFPSGGHTTEIKLAEARLLAGAGVDELDLVLNVGKLRSGDLIYVENEIRCIVRAAAIPVKVILEVCYLTRNEIRTACDMSIRAGAAFVKTSTGWAPGGTTLDVVSWICSLAGSAIQVKAAGGIRDLDTVVAMLRMGVTRFGMNAEAAAAVLRELAARPGGFIEI
jgi:deoxyribose-phosphate aldolase